MPRLLTALFLFCLSTNGWAAAAAQPAPARATAPPLVALPAAPPAATPAAPGPGETDEQAALPPPSSTAQKLYASAKGDLLQIRMLLKNGRSQSSVGSGFMIGTSDLVLTNYHVVSQMALDPAIYAGEYIDTDGKTGPVTLLAVDVLHDLAVVRVDRKGTGYFKLPDKPQKLTSSPSRRFDTLMPATSPPAVTLGPPLMPELMGPVNISWS